MDHVIAIACDRADFLAPVQCELQVSRLLHAHVLVRASWLHVPGCKVRVRPRSNFERGGNPEHERGNVEPGT